MERRQSRTEKLIKHCRNPKSIVFLVSSMLPKFHMNNIFLYELNYYFVPLDLSINTCQIMNEFYCQFWLRK